MILVTGRAGFMGSNFELDWLAGGGEPLLSVKDAALPLNAAEVCD